MIPFIVTRVKPDDRLVLINNPAPQMFGITFVQTDKDVVLEAPCEFMGAQFFIDVVLLVTAVNINVGAVKLRPVDQKSNGVFQSDTNRFQFLAGDMARMAFKSFMEDSPESFEKLIAEASQHGGL